MTQGYIVESNGIETGFFTLRVASKFLLDELAKGADAELYGPDGQLSPEELDQFEEILAAR